MPGMALVLGDLVSETELGLTLAHGGPETLRRPVAGAHAIEIPHPMQWLDADWVILTTGLRLRGDAAAQRTFVREAAGRGLAAIAFGVEVVFRSIPSALLDEARLVGLPVLAVAGEVPFRRIVSFVEQALAVDTLRVLRRRLDIETSLVDSMTRDEPEEAVVRRLGALTDTSVALYRLDGRVSASVGVAPLEAIRRQLRTDTDASELTVGRWSVAVEPVLAGSETYGQLVLATRQRGGLDDVMRAAVRSAARLLGVVDLAQEAIRAGERTIRAEVLDLLLDPNRAADVPEERLTALGFDPSRDARVALVAVTSRARGGTPRAGELSRAERLLELAAGSSGCPAVVARRRGRMTVVFQERDRDLEGWVARLAAAGFGAAAGVGRPFRGGGRGAIASLRDAELAVDHVHRRGGDAPHATLRFEDFGLAEWLLASADPATLATRSASTLEPLDAHAELRRTLLAYLDADLDVQATAAGLHLHENSLRYRLRRVETLLGVSLRDLPTLVDLHLATAAERATRRSLAPAAG